MFSGKGLVIHELSPQEHDRQVARSQAVVHFIGRLLDEMQFRRTAIDARTAEELNLIRETICADKLDLSRDLFRYNESTRDVVVHLKQSCDRLPALLAGIESPSNGEANGARDGIEPPTRGFSVRCSTKLSYLGIEKLQMESGSDDITRSSTNSGEASALL